MWSKSSTSPQDATFVYRLAPTVCAAAIACAVMVVPFAGRSSQLMGDDMLVLVGFLALARFALATSAFDPGGGFHLMGASRDLMFSVFAEPMLLAALAIAAIQSGTTSLHQIAASNQIPQIIQSPAHWCAALVLALTVLVETGRQPIDNPDTHLELTMVHEGPLLAYSGRDLAMLHWSASARHWITMSLFSTLVIPLPGHTLLNVLSVGAFMVTGCAALAVVESMIVKLRIMRVPALLGSGLIVALFGLASLAVSQ